MTPPATLASPSTTSAHPAGTLPPDVLVDIFLFTRQPTRISHVCQDWRHVALEAALLWTTIVFQPGRHGELTDFLEKPTEWIKRSKGALLDIEIQSMTGGGNLSFVSALAIGQIMELIRPHATRWRSMTMSEVPRGQIKALVKAFQATDMPNLEVLRVAHHRTERHWAWAVMDLKQRAPKLTDVQLPGGQIALTRGYINSLAGLRHLVISRTNFFLADADAVGQICDLIERCPQLQTLHITTPNAQVYLGDPLNIGLRKVVAHHLTDFHLHCPNLFAAILPSLRLPALQRLPHFIYPHFLPIIHDFNPFPNIEVLSIRSPYGPWNRPFTDLPPLLANLTSLDSLTLYALEAGASSDDQWVAQFASVCPNLTFIKFDWASALKLSETAIRKLVEGRIDWGHPLRSLTIELESGYEEDDDLPQPSEEWLAWMKAHVPEVHIAWKAGMVGHLFD